MVGSWKIVGITSQKPCFSLKMRFFICWLPICVIYFVGKDAPNETQEFSSLPHFKTEIAVWQNLGIILN